MPPNRWAEKVLLSAVPATALVVVILLCGCNSALHPYQVAGNSMRPLLKQGDRIFVDESRQARAVLHDGDVIVIRRDGAIVLKRILAMPGETISGTDRKVFRNGKQIDEPYLAPATRDDLSALTTFQSKTVAPEELFVMGDDRELSFDSRASEYAPVRFSDVVGQYSFIYWHASSAPKKD